MKNVWTNNFILLVTAIVISLLLHVAHVLLPFMFGPIIASIIVIKVFKLEVKWPFWLSQIGLILLGVQIGSTFTSEVLHDIKNDWLIIVVITLLLLVLSLLIAFFFKKIARVNTETAILSVIPGALSQMLIMAEENKKANILVVSLTQTSRVIFVVILVPLISYFFSSDGGNETTSIKSPPLTEVLNLSHIIILMCCIAIIYSLMAKINFPTKQLLAPIVVLVIWNLTTHHTFTLDNYILATAQVIYMIRIGLQIANLLSDLKGRIAVAIIYQNVFLIIGSFIMVYIVHIFTNNNINELFLGGAPGGMSQIVLVAMATGADVAMISSFHIFRIFFILFVVAPVIGFFLRGGISKFHQKR